MTNLSEPGAGKRRLVKALTQSVMFTERKNRQIRSDTENTARG